MTTFLPLYGVKGPKNDFLNKMLADGAIRKLSSFFTFLSNFEKNRFFTSIRAKGKKKATFFPIFSVNTTKFRPKAGQKKKGGVIFFSGPRIFGGQDFGGQGKYDPLFFGALLD